MRQANDRVHTALRPRTSAAYLSKFKLFLAFVVWYQFPIHALDTILAFFEFLVQNGTRTHSLTSYVSVLRHYFNLYDIDTLPLNHRKVHLFIKSVSINSSYFPRYKATITVPILTKLILACDNIRYDILYKPVFLLAYFAFLRLSNMAPPSSKSFDPTRHFLRSDVVFGPPGAHIIVKWAKAMQGSNKHHVVQIPSLSSSPSALSKL